MQIYIIENLINGKYYVGKTINKDLNYYLKRAIAMAQSGKDNRKLLHRAIRKYGGQAFVIRQLIECNTNEQASIFERLWIIVLDSRNNSIGYNVSAGGEGSLGVKHSLETRKKMSEGHKGQVGWNKGLRYKRPKEVCINFAGSLNGFFGKVHSIKTRQKIAEANKRRIWTDESRAKMSETKKAEWKIRKGILDVAPR